MYRASGVEGGKHQGNAESRVMLSGGGKYTPTYLGPATSTQLWSLCYKHKGVLTPFFAAKSSGPVSEKSFGTLSNTTLPSDWTIDPQALSSAGGSTD